MAVMSDELPAAVEGPAATVQRESSAEATMVTPGVCGGVARVRQARIPVWTSIGFQRPGRSEPELLADDPSLTAADLDAVRAYYRAHTIEIAAAIADEERDD